MKAEQGPRLKPLNGLSPCGESGLKEKNRCVRKGKNSLSPCGESGLKVLSQKYYVQVMLSFPLWGKWIERSPVKADEIYQSSFPLWGKWIESLSPFKIESGKLTSFPLWGKWIERNEKGWVLGTRFVFPLVGKVD